MANFKDNFSKQSDTYLKYRPTYPDELFNYLTSLTTKHELAWDCGTGNGQAAIGLANHFDRIYASDASQEQINNAYLHEKVEYHVELAEKTNLKDASVDLISVAIALHWFEFDAFYAEAWRVLKPGGIIAAWTYRLPTISPKVDAVIRRFHDEVVDEYWLMENRLVEEGYRTIPFPFNEIEPPEFVMQKEWALADLIGLVSSWSALQRIIQQTGKNPIPDFQKELCLVWGDPMSVKRATWRLILKIGQATSK